MGRRQRLRFYTCISHISHFNSGNSTLKFTPAGPDHAQIAAAAGMADYIDALYAHHYNEETEPSNRAELVHDLKRNYERELLKPLLDFLSNRNDLRLLGPCDQNLKVPTIAVDVGSKARKYAKALGEQGIMAGAGDFYAVRTLKSLGVDPNNGVLRLSFVHYTNREEVNKLLSSLDNILGA